MRKSQLVRYFVATVIVSVLGAALVVAEAEAKAVWLSNFQSAYPAATRLHTCGVCHTNFFSNSPKNPYGLDFLSAGGKNNPAAALAAIEGWDSDNDGTTNISEINEATGFMPGYTCSSYTSAINAPASIADYVDPTNPGCSPVICAQPLSTGSRPTASDCLYILQAAVRVATCTPECACAPTGSLPITATDALLCLANAVGTSTTLNCPCP